MELPPAGVHLVPLVNPLVFAKFGVEGALLEGAQLEGEPWPQLLDSHLLLILENIPVEAEEDEVTLVVEGGHLAADELGVVGEEGCKEATDAVTQTRGEVVEDHLGGMLRWILTAPLHLFTQPDIADLEVSSGTIREVTQDHSIGNPAVLVDHHEVREAAGHTLRNDSLEGKTASVVDVSVWDDCGQLITQLDCSCLGSV